MRKLKGKSPKLAKPSRPKILVFGPAGVGKTWSSLDWPSCYYIDCEDGASLPHYTQKLDDVGASYFGQEDGANDFESVINEVMTLATVKHDRKTLIIDSLTKLFNTAIQTEHDRMIAAGEKPAFGSEKKPAISCLRRLVHWIDKLDMNVILICHEKAKWHQGEQIGLEADCDAKLPYELNLVVQIFRTGKSRRARVIKSRFEQFAEAESMDWTFAEFGKRFGETTNADATFVELASEEQVNEARKLVDQLGVTREEVSKVFSKENVSAWDELSSERIAKAITGLQKRKVAV